VPTVPPDKVAVVTESGADCTVSVVLPETLFSVAEIAVVPAFAPVANPPAAMEATPEDAELQVTWAVRFLVELSE
jgi:hypothetical protein